jgi:protein-S-isoprenylcysteine O-methyltransferase Ste14
MKKRIKLQGIFIFAAITIVLALHKFIFPYWTQEPWDEFLDALGIAFILFGFIFRIAARGYKAEISCEGKSLITDGPYGLMRNPMYFGTFLIGLGIILVLFMWWAFFVFLAIFALIYIFQVRKEEKTLFRRFGDEYKRYCEITPRYFPRLVTVFTADFRKYVFLKWNWVKKELPSLILVISLVIIIETWEDVRLFGQKEFLKEFLELFSIVISFVITMALFLRKTD